MTFKVGSELTFQLAWVESVRPQALEIGEGFVTVGDSLTSCQIENGVPGTCWPSAVAAALSQTYQNAAVNGQSSTDWSVRGNITPPYWPCSSPPVVKPYNQFVDKAQGKRWVVVMIGAGDALREVECPPGGFENWTLPTTPDRFEANIRQFVSNVWTDVPGIVGVLLATPPYFKHPNINWALQNALIDEYHSRLVSIAMSDKRARTNANFDMRDVLSSTDYADDLLHPAQSGQDKLAAQFEIALGPFF